MAAKVGFLRLMYFLLAGQGLPNSQYYNPNVGSYTSFTGPMLCTEGTSNGNSEYEMVTVTCYKNEYNHDQLFAALEQQAKQGNHFIEFTKLVRYVNGYRTTSETTITITDVPADDLKLLNVRVETSRLIKEEGEQCGLPHPTKDTAEISSGLHMYSQCCKCH